MRKIRLILSYDGTDYHGFQRQKGQKTIQETVENALSRLTKESTQIIGSGRTDRGVHALEQVCHFTTESTIPADRFSLILRDQLPTDILAIASDEVEASFHAQKDACFKTYRYQFETAKIPSLIERRYFTHYPYPLDIQQMQLAANDLIGTHDFTSLCSVKTEVVNRVRSIYQCRIHTKEQKVMLDVTGSGFLYNMVRIIAGTLYQIGRSKLPIDQFQKIMPTKDRTLAGPTLPPEGLFLMKVGYEPWQESS